MSSSTTGAGGLLSGGSSPQSSPGGQGRNLGERAFTMVEIALALGVIVIAMIAIMGVLPTGLKVQRENREETTVLLDGTYLMEAIRGGAKGLDDLTNYVDSITITNFTGRGRGTALTYNRPGFSTNTPTPLTNGFQIVGLLSTPKYFAGRPPSSNIVTARVRAIAGSAAVRAMTNKDFAFSYLVTSEVIPVTMLQASYTNFFGTGANAGSPVNVEQSNRWRYATTVSSNLFDLRLVFQWPVFTNAGNLVVGNNRKVYRTKVSGSLTRTNLRNSPVPYYFFEPSSYMAYTNR